MKNNKASNASRTWSRVMFFVAAAIMIFITISSAVSAQVFYPDLSLTYPTYFYYQGYNNLPTVSGPYPRYYLAERDGGSEFLYDDFDHFDDFVGYKDLDVFYPAEGRIDVVRNPNPEPLDLSQINTSMKLFGEHIYGQLPGGAIYRKHYMHEHPWELDSGYGYFTPVIAYRNKPVYTHPCQQIGICENTRCCN